MLLHGLALFGFDYDYIENSDKIFYTDIKDSNNTWMDKKPNIDFMKNITNNYDLQFKFYIKPELVEINNILQPKYPDTSTIYTNHAVTFSTDDDYSNTGSCGWYGCNVAYLSENINNKDESILKWEHGETGISISYFNFELPFAHADTDEYKLRIFY